PALPAESPRLVRLSCDLLRARCLDHRGFLLRGRDEFIVLPWATLTRRNLSDGSSRDRRRACYFGLILGSCPGLGCRLCLGNSRQAAHRCLQTPARTIRVSLADPAT